MRRDLLQPVSAKESSGIVPLILLILITFSLFIYLSAVPGGNSSLITFILICTLSVVLAFTDSPYLIQYLLYIWVAAPGLRRMLDYLQDTFQAVSPLVVVALATTLTTLIPILRRRIKLDSGIIRALGLVAIAILYASILGLLRNGTPAIYDIANFCIPILILIYMSIQKLDTHARDSLIRSFVNMAVLVAAYGWIQFLFVPVWDAYWVNHAHMKSLGIAHSLTLKVFSTMNAPSSVACLLGLALVPMLLVPRWRGIFGLFGIVVVAGALAFTLVRSVWIFLAVGMFTFILTGNGKQRWTSAVRLALTVGIIAILFPFIPGLKTISKRADTITDIKHDQSYQIRMLGTFNALEDFFKEPMGKGLGSLGESSKLASDTTENTSLNFVDNGFIVIMNTFGLLGTAALFLGLGMLFKTMRKSNFDHPQYRDYTKLGLAAFLYYFASLPFGNSLQGVTAVFLWFLVGLGFAKPPEAKVSPKPTSFSPNLHRGFRV